MNDHLEFEGRNVNQAVKKACETLGTHPEALDYDVVSRGISGIFGFGNLRKARIRVKVEESTRGILSEALLQTSTDAADPFVPDGSSDKDRKSPVEAEIDASYERIAVGEKVLRRIVDALSEESRIQIERNGTCVRYQIQGGNSGLLIGKRGQTLEAMQTIVEKTVNRLGGERIHIAVDVEQYLANRKAGLIRSARSLAQKARTTGKPVTIGYLNAQDRRTIHIALKDEAGISTQSAGDGYMRKLKIYPGRRFTRH
ncbi:MAG: protein jag [Desulfobacterales bacterium]